MLRYALVAVLLFAPPSLASQETDDWWLLVEAEAGTKLYGRTSELRAFKATQARRSIWIKGDYSRNAKTRWRTTMIQYFFDCSAGTYFMGDGVAYLPDGSSTRVPRDHSYTPVIPETVTAGLYDWVCYTYSN